MGLLTPSGPPTAEADPPLTRVEHVLLPVYSFVVLPLFALANVGVELSASSIAAAAGSSVAWAILVARVGGKLFGIWGGAMLASRLRLADLPAGVRSTHLAGIAVAAGTGFTVSLFVAEVAFGREALCSPPSRSPCSRRRSFPRPWGSSCCAGRGGVSPKGASPDGATAVGATPVGARRCHEGNLSRFSSGLGRDPPRILPLAPAAAGLSTSGRISNVHGILAQEGGPLEVLFTSTETTYLWVIFVISLLALAFEK